MSEHKPHIFIKIVKVTAWIAVSVLLLLALFRFSLKTSFVRDMVKTQVERIGSNALNGQLTIEKIDGDLGSDFVIHNLSVIQSDTVIALKIFSVNYNLYELIRGKFTASQLTINGITANINEQPTGSFDIENLVKTPEQSEDIADSSSFGFPINIESFTISESNISVHSPTYLPDSTLKIQNLNLSSSLSYHNEISASLANLSFRILEGRLPEPIMVQSSAGFYNQEITLNELVVETGRSLLTTSGFSSLRTDSIHSTSEFQPLSLSDIQPYLPQFLPDDELHLTIMLTGQLSDIHLELSGRSNAVNQISIKSNLNLTKTPSLHNLSISGNSLDLGYYLPDSLQVTAGDFYFNVEGTLSENLSEADLRWDAHISNFQYDSYIIPSFGFNGILKENRLAGELNLINGQDEISAVTRIQNVFSELPEWYVHTTLQDFNPAKWLNNPELRGDINLAAELTGNGFSLDESPWKFSVNKSNVDDSLKIMDYNLSDLSIEGQVNKDSLSTNGYVTFGNSIIDLTAAASNYLTEIPSYAFNVSSERFDARNLAGFEDTPTSINLKLSGNGQYFDLDNLNLNTRLDIDSSYVNGALINNLDVNAELNQLILTISKGILESEMIEGSFTGQRNLVDVTDPENDIELDLTIKNLQPMAPWLGAEIFNANGKLTGNVNELSTKKMLFDGRIELNDIVYDTVFSAQSIEGNTQITFNDYYLYGFSVDINEPTYANYNLQDLNFSASGAAMEDSLSGDFTLNIASDDAGEILQSGTFGINTATKNAHLTWQTFDFQTPASRLILQAPFNFHYTDGTIKTDTLDLLSPSGTFLKLSIPFADSLNQEVWARGQDFNFGVIQEIIFNERFVDGILSGKLYFSQSPTEFFGDGAVNISKLSYRNTEVDEFNLNFKIAEERLTAFMNVLLDGKEKISGNLNLPFIAADPSTYEDSFFDEPVEAQLQINPVALSEFENLLREFEITNTQGIFSFSGNLSGTVREPNLDGSFSLGKPTLSGIAVDTAFAQFQYHHLEEKITALAEINARGQKAASISAELPFSFDFIAMKLNMPDETDSLHFNLLTNNFNISVFNDFLDKQYMTGLRGSLNADINITGTPNNLQPTGFLQLSGARVAVPIAGITLSDIGSEFGFTEQGFELKQLTAKSGSGSFNASGTIDLKGIYPTNLNLRARASRFRLANTSDYNLIIDLNSQLTGKPTRPKASGNLTVKNGFIYLQDFGERSVESVELEGEDASSFSPYDSLAINMNFIIEDGFQVRNRRYLDMEIEMNGELEAQKQTDGELQLFGALIADKGFVRPLGKNFTLDDGSFSFSGPIDNPDINIRTSYIPQTTQKQSSPITLFYIIEGSAQDPTFRFESDPQMEQQNIICYTLFNKPCYALESWQQAISGSSSGSSPTDLLVDVLLDEVEQLATQQLGIDVVQIENTRSGSGSATSIKTGWYLNRKTFFAIVNEISGTTPKTLFILEYLLTKNLDLILTQGDDNRQGIDIRWHYDY